jgi:HSP90 family molecular chaperone
MAKPTLTMKYAGGLIKHLGLQMYSGAVPSIAELIKNAYDANATEVNINVPFGSPWSAGSTIVVEDNGHGMSFADCDNKYLVIGRDRREVDSDRVLGNPNRRPIGRKGIGKLAGFGIAYTVEIKTIQNRKRSTFEMIYRDIEKLNLGEEYP